MPKKQSVKLNLPVVLQAIKNTCYNNTDFCNKMGRKQYWVTDWGRGKSLPSPEEAARMCAILQVEPEEILLEQNDIELVRSLIEKEKNVQPSTAEGKGLSQLEPWEIEAITFLRSLSEGQRKVALAVAEEAAKRLEKFSYLLPENEPEQK